MNRMTAAAFLDPLENSGEDVPPRPVGEVDSYGNVALHGISISSLALADRVVFSFCRGALRPV